MNRQQNLNALAGFSAGFLSTDKGHTPFAAAMEAEADGS